MELVKKYKNIIIAVIVAGLIAWGYSAFFGGASEGDNLLLVSTQTQSQEDILRNELLALLLQLRVLHLDETIFTDPRFISLTDFSVELLPQPVGRSNPFLPIGSDGGDGPLSTSTPERDGG